MKKNILFIISNMESGGFQKSLISLLQCFDFNKYNVDLLILSYKGIFLRQIPKEVNIIRCGINENFFESFPKAVLFLLKDREIDLSIKRCIHFLISRFNKGKAGIYMSKQIPGIDKEYDVAIDYNGQHVMYYMVDKIKAKKKISYFHSDYKKWSYYKTGDELYYPKVDYILTVSDICKKSLEDIFEGCKSKIRVIHNISSPKVIKELASKKCSVKFSHDYINIIMVGRPSEVKGYDFAIKACKKLKDEGYKAKFYSIGTSDDIDKYKKMVKDFNIINEFTFIGETSNPYCFMIQADMYIHPSRFEGKSVAIDEAKILCKPIIITNFTTATDHIVNDINGLIVEMSVDGVYNGIKKLIDNKNLALKLSNNLSKESLGNENEIYKLYELIEN